jgi:hypothetical protein
LNSSVDWLSSATHICCTASARRIERRPYGEGNRSDFRALKAAHFSQGHVVSSRRRRAGFCFLVSEQFANTILRTLFNCERFAGQAKMRRRTDCF